MWEIIIAVAVGTTAICVAAGHVVKVLKKLWDAALKAINSRLDTIEQVNARLELLNLMQHSPENTYAINRAYDAYKLKGWNSYIHDAYKKWHTDVNDKDEKG